MGTDPSSGSSSSSRSNTTSGGEFGHGIGVTVGVVVLIIIVAITSYLCARFRVPDENHHGASSSLASTSGQAIDIARVEIDDVDERNPGAELPRPGHSGRETIQRGSLSAKSNSSLSRCSICLRGYKEGDALSSLPCCHHLFHTKCIDPWLQLNPTCPICRSSPATTPVSTPLVELAPLTGRGGQSYR
ncbi:hypothetical protein CDL15_Pgr011535 [Punica granatum]|nr:hypothetical protein CDL15_Pgr011535 [Punica granatum]